MSNSSNSTDMDILCDVQGSFSQITRQLVNFGLTPAYFLLGLSGRVISLVAIRQESKQEKAYLYQIFVLISEAVEIFLYTTFMITFRWLSTFSSLSQWFNKCYFCMWYTAHMTHFFNNLTTGVTLFLTCAMIVDRIFALKRPIKHQQLKHDKIQTTTLILSIVICILSVFPFALTTDVSNPSPDGTYKVIYSPFLLSTAFKVYLQFHMIFKGGLAILLSIGNVILYFEYRKAMKKRANIRSKENQQINKDINDRMSILFKMSMCQSVANILTVSVNISYKFLVLYLDAYTSNCILAPVVDGITELCDILEFYIILAISKQFRRMVAKSLRKLIRMPCADENSVQLIGSSVQVQPAHS